MQITSSKGVPAAPSAAPHGARLQSGVELELFRSAGGPVNLPVSDLHRLKIHASDPVGGTCGASRFLYRRGDIDLIPAGEGDAWFEDGPSAAWLVGISRELLVRVADEMGKNAGHARFDPRHQIRDPTIEHIATALTRAEEHPGGRLYFEGLGLALTAHLLGGYAQAEAKLRGLSKPQERRLVAYIDEHLDQGLSLATLAGVAGVSASHLKTLFKRSFGVPVHEFVVRRRVERARALLRESDRSIAQVAFDAGFAHPSHLARCMRRLLGVTPKMLRS